MRESISTILLSLISSSDSFLWVQSIHLNNPARENSIDPFVLRIFLSFLSSLLSRELGNESFLVSSAPFKYKENIISF